MSQINSLTDAQKALIPVYRDRWRRVALSTAPIDPDRAKTAVKQAYAAMGKPTPDIWLFPGPHAAKEALGSKTLPQLMQEFGIPILQPPFAANLRQALSSQIAADILDNSLQELQSLGISTLSFNIHASTWGVLAGIFPQGETSIEAEAFGEFSEQMLSQQWEQQQQQWRQQLRQQPGGDWLIGLGDTLWQWGEPLGKFVEDNVWQPLKSQPEVGQWERGFRQFLGGFAIFGAGIGVLVNATQAAITHPVLLDYCLSVLDCSCDRQQWEAWRSLATECGPFIMFQKACIVLDRPSTLSVDAENRLHAEGEPALQFADGYRQYNFQGVTLPEKYGKLHPHQWDAKWLLTETNAELRRVLIQGIGYGRICQELQATSLDSWREYTLLRIDVDVDVEPIYLLKMSCPSTGHIHATRVPPEMKSAREAITWMNWGVDPEEFVVET
jgi:hypothetical protein